MNKYGKLHLPSPRQLGTRFYLAVVIVLVYLLLLCFGIALAHSTGSYSGSFPTPGDMQHIIKCLGGLVIGTALCFLHWRFFEKWAWLFYGIVLVGLVAVLLFAPTVNGTRRWLYIGVTRIQVSEFAKIALVLLLARFLKVRRDRRTLTTSLYALLLTLVPMFLILREPDLGTSLMLPPVFLAMLFCAGGKIKHILTIILIGIVMIPIVYEFGLASYQKRRIEAFLSPGIAEELDPDSVLQLSLSQEAIGTGGLFGKGYGMGNPDLPVRECDFIFTVVAEELGFLMASLLIFLYFLLYVFALETGVTTNDLFGRLVCTGLSVSLLFQTVINTSMTMHLVPITGINLPFLSSGGSSLLTSSIMISLMINIALRPPRSLARPSRTLKQ